MVLAHQNYGHFVIVCPFEQMGVNIVSCAPAHPKRRHEARHLRKGI